MKDTKIISAFPGTGKTHFFNNTDLFVLDSDSSYFDKTKFPQNYIEHIKSYLGKVDYILVSSHKDVREALEKNGIDFYLMYPSIESKQEYINRYIERGSALGFIILLKSNWDNWIKDCANQKGCIKIVLENNEYLKDIINKQ